MDDMHPEWRQPIVVATISWSPHTNDYVLHTTMTRQGYDSIDAKLTFHDRLVPRGVTPLQHVLRTLGSELEALREIREGEVGRLPF